MSVAKTALHTTRGCEMFDVPLGVQTGYWDTAVGVPNDFGGVDWTVREARDCFVYDPHQWLNQGCVAEDNYEGTLGTPLNKKGGGLFGECICRCIHMCAIYPSYHGQRHLYFQRCNIHDI